MIGIPEFPRKASKELFKTRTFPEHNYKGIYFNGKTLRLTLDPSKPITELKYPEFFDVCITGKCEGACPYCVTEDTLINTIDGDQRIKDIKVGDIVYNIDARNMDLKTNDIEQLHSREYSGDLIKLDLEDGSCLKITPNHKVFVISKGWVLAKDLKEGDDIFSLNNP